MSQERILQVGVKILIENDNGEILLLRRSSEKYPDIDGRWDIVGGRIEVGSLLLENLAREVKEETGLELVGQPILIGAQDILRAPKKHIVRLTYKGKAVGALVLDQQEHDDFDWYPIDKLEAHSDLDVYLKELLCK